MFLLFIVRFLRVIFQLNFVTLQVAISRSKIMRKIWEKIEPIVRNKYIITLVAFVVYIVFFDSNSLIDRWKTHQEIENLQEEIEFYRSHIESDKAKIDALNSSLENLEKFAREEYLMHNDDEEVFIINE